jgi:hypothetical protein
LTVLNFQDAFARLDGKRSELARTEGLSPFNKRLLDGAKEVLASRQ